MKLMMKIITRNGNQKTNAITLLAEAHGVIECFCDIQKCFGFLHGEIKEIDQNGITKGDIRVDVQIFSTADLKVLYVTGNFGAPCPICSITQNNLDLQGTSETFPPRPFMRDLRDQNNFDRWQRKNTLSKMILRK